jgi:hypothetical protein
MSSNKIICSSFENVNCNKLISQNNKFNLIMQEDGNLVIYNNRNPLWATNTINKGVGPYNLYMQSDGNLVIYDGNSQATWSSNTSGNIHSDYRLFINNIGDLEIICDDRLLWSSIFILDDNIPNIPEIMPSTQSWFYMPFLTHVYYLINGIKITDILRKNIKTIMRIKNVNYKLYKIIIEEMLNFLENNDGYKRLLNTNFERDTLPNEDTIGHISGDTQEQILQQINIVDDNFNSLHFYEDNKNIYNLLQNILLCHYDDDICLLLLNTNYKQKYLKYKQKYLELKNSNI